MGVLPIDKAREAAAKAYDELQIPVGSPPEHVIATFRTLCLKRAFAINSNDKNDHENGNKSDDKFQRQAVAYRFLQSLPLLENTEYYADAILARLRPLEQPRGAHEPSVERASAMLDLSISTMEQAQRTWQLPYTNYVITVHYCLRKHLVRRRYSEFEALHKALQSRLPVIPLLPERSWLDKLRMPGERARSLTQYLLRVITMLSNRGLFSIEIMAFLGVEYTKIRAEEEALALEFLSRAAGGGGGTVMYYIVSAAWLEMWKRFIHDGTQPPSTIMNGHLLHDPSSSRTTTTAASGAATSGSTTTTAGATALVAKQGLVVGQHYRCVNFFTWQYLCLVYGGGPLLIRKTPSIYGRNAVDTHTLAVTLQKIVRGFLGRRHASKRQLYVLRQDPSFEKRLSALERQKLLEDRMVILRKYVSAREHQIRHIAALKIQRALRKFLLRHEYALLMVESAVPNAAETFQHVDEYFSLEEIGLIRDPKYRLAHFLVTMNKGVPIQKLRSRRKTPQWRLFRIDAIGSQLLWSSKKKMHSLAFCDVKKLLVESPLMLKSGFGRRRSMTHDHAVVLTYKESTADSSGKEANTASSPTNTGSSAGATSELILICESQCDCDALYFGLNALLSETRGRTANGATYVDGHGVIRKKYPHAKRLIHDAQKLIDHQLHNPFKMNNQHK